MAARKTMQCKRYQEEKGREKENQRGEKKNSERVVNKKVQIEILQIFVPNLREISVWCKRLFQQSLTSFSVMAAKQLV